MSLKTKKLSALTLKVLAIGLFVFLMTYNVKIDTGNISSVSDLADISAGVNSASAQSEGGGGSGFTVVWICYYWSAIHDCMKLDYHDCPTLAGYPCYRNW